MARKRTTPPPPRVPAKEDYAAAVRRHDFAAALPLARARHAANPTPQTLADLRNAVYRAALDFADADNTAAVSAALVEAELYSPADADWRAKAAAATARAGIPESFADPNLSPEVRAAAYAHYVDHAVRKNQPAGLNPYDVPVLDAVAAAFAAHEAGDDEVVREKLAAVRLASPFLEWKLLLRGLTAHATNDDVAAAENWKRLTPDRLPAKLAAPLRAKIDPAFRSSLPAERAATLGRAFDALTPDDLLEKLRTLRGELGKNKTMTKAWKAAEAVVPKLRAAAPDAVPTLAMVMYHAVAKQGEPADLPKYAKLFGTPADDPKFDRLQATACGDAGMPDRALTHWAKYEAWLAGPGCGWPADITARARAIVLLRMGRIAAAMSAAAPQPALPRGMPTALRDLIFGADAPRRTPPPADDFFRRSRDLAPEWAEPGLALFNVLAAKNAEPEAEAAARFVLARHPDEFHTLQSLAAMLQQQGRAAESLELWRRALAANPLDHRLRVLTSHAAIGAARHALIANDAAGAAAVLDANRELCEAENGPSYFPLRVVIGLKLGVPDAAAAARIPMLPGGRLAAALTLASDAVLAKLKPAQKKVIDVAFKAALAVPPTPLEVNVMYGAWDGYFLTNIEFRGQKAQEKAIFGLIEECPQHDGPEVDFENLARGLVVREVWKLAAKVLPRLAERFPRNPLFRICQAETLAAVSPRKVPGRDMGHLLAAATAGMAGDLPPRYADLPARLQKLRAEHDGPDDMLDFLFDPRRRR